MGIRHVAVAFAVATTFGTAHAQSRPAQDDWAMLNKSLSLIEVLMSVSAASQDDPKAGTQAFNELLSGRNADANALMREIFADVPSAERDRLVSIGRSMVAMGEKQVAAEARSAGEVAAIQARKDLTAMGLKYYDNGQFLEAVKRGDVLAARLFLVGRGVDPAAKTLLGYSALDLAQRGGNPEMIALLSAALVK
jgi:hypothetical protein